MQKNDLLISIEKVKQEYYSKEKKNTFFTSKQKLALAETVSNSISQEDLTARTVYVVHNTNKIFVDYTIFKLFANPSNYQYLVSYMITLLDYCIENYNSYEVHVNLDTFSVSACHRFKEVIELYLNECMKHNTEFTDKLNKMHLYNIPSVFETIQKLLSPFMHEIVKQKIELHKKTESASLLSQLVLL